jgi:hypothetical protein
MFWQGWLFLRVHFIANMQAKNMFSTKVMFAGLV